jgi:hypothetical protein
MGLCGLLADFLRTKISRCYVLRSVASLRTLSIAWRTLLLLTVLDMDEERAAIVLVGVSHARIRLVHRHHHHHATPANPNTSAVRPPAL